MKINKKFKYFMSKNLPDITDKMWFPVVFSTPDKSQRKKVKV